MTNTIKSFIETLKSLADIAIDNYTILIQEGGVIVASLRYEEDPWGEGDNWDETRVTAVYINPTIPDHILNFLAEAPIVRGVREAWKEGVRETFMLKGWHVK